MTQRKWVCVLSKGAAQRKGELGKTPRNAQGSGLHAPSASRGTECC